MDPRASAILSLTEKWMLSGSREICPEMVKPETDYDFMVMEPAVGSEKAKVFIATLEANGFVQAIQYDPITTELLGHDPETKLWQLDEKPKTDIILFSDEGIYEKWETATKVCKALHLTERKHRLMVFRAIRTGKFFDPEKKEVENNVGVVSSLDAA